MNYFFRKSLSLMVEIILEKFKNHYKKGSRTKWMIESLAGWDIIDRMNVLALILFSAKGT